MSLACISVPGVVLADLQDAQKPFTFGIRGRCVVVARGSGQVLSASRHLGRSFESS